MKTIFIFTLVLLTHAEIRAQDASQDVQLNGLKKEYYPSGQICKEYYIENGVPNGIVKSYSEKGFLVSQQNVVYGIPNGIQKFFYENGQVRYENNFEDGKPQGISKEYYEDGTLKINSFLNGEPWELTGNTDMYYENGLVKTKSTFFKGKITVQVNYDRKGRIVSEFKDGQSTSYWYEENGKRHVSINGKPQD